MCGFLLTISAHPIDNEDLIKASAFIQRRGPDTKEEVRLLTSSSLHLYAAHYLLDVSGQASSQPIILPNLAGQVEKLVLFNGELYNFKELVPCASSDTEALSALMKDKGPACIDNLDGEFAIVAYDEISSCVTVATDPFMTKPVCVGWSEARDKFGVASYPSALESIGLSSIEFATPNMVRSYDISRPSTWKIPSETPSQESELYSFNINQTIQAFEAWEDSFLESIKKRAMHGNLPVFVPLSSGYDSGAICLALNMLGIPYRTITIDSREDQDVLLKRIKINGASRGSCEEHVNIPMLSPDECRNIRERISEECEPFSFLHSPQTLLDDDGSIGAYRVGQEAKARGWLVGLSGCGADEIISDYGFNGVKHYPHSEFGGLFPESLYGFYPWKKFYGDSMRSYLFKDELIFGIFGIEGRYPFLDKDLVQEFLALSHNLKNHEYKAPVAAFLRKHAYPFEHGVKRGFSPYGDHPPINGHGALPGVHRLVHRIKAKISQLIDWVD